jgi:hypothetical protein
MTRKQLERIRRDLSTAYNSDPDLDGEGGGGSTQPKGQEPNDPDDKGKGQGDLDNPPEPPKVNTSGDGDRIKALEAKLEKERKAREKLETEKAAREESKKTDLEKAQARAELETEKAKTATARLESVLRDNALRDAASKAGARGDRLAAILKITDKSGITVDEDGAMVGADAAIKSAKEEFPEFFGSSSTANLGSGGGKTGDRDDDGDKGPQTDYEVGQAIARKGKKKNNRL